MYQYTGGEDDTEESTCNTLDTAIGNGFADGNANTDVRVSPKIFEIIKDKTRRNK